VPVRGKEGYENNNNERKEDRMDVGSRRTKRMRKGFVMEIKEKKEEEDNKVKLK
jgi:hypothetical protein